MKARPKVVALAEAMERKLSRHDGDRGKDGWLSESPSWLLERLEEETKELTTVVGMYEESTDPSDRERRRKMVLKEAADVANFAMMVADVCHALDSR